jgi:hypothetical protein
MKWMPNKRYIALCQEKVDYYKPLIEERLGIDLGDVKVGSRKDLKKYLHSEVNEALTSVLNERNFGRAKKAIAYAILYPVMHTLAEYYIVTTDRNSLATTKGDSIIYFNEKQKSYVLKNNILDSTARHELGHISWTVLGGEEVSIEEPIVKAMNEGFALYCEQILLKDQNNGNVIASGRNADYFNCARLICHMIGIKGDDFSKKIPSEWRDYVTRIPLGNHTEPVS